MTAAEKKVITDSIIKAGRCGIKADDGHVFYVMSRSIKKDGSSTPYTNGARVVLAKGASGYEQSLPATAIPALASVADRIAAIVPVVEECALIGAFRPASGATATTASMEGVAVL